MADHKTWDIASLLQGISVSTTTPADRSTMVDELERRIKDLIAERDEADRLAGAAGRLSERYSEWYRKNQSWLREAKEAEGYDNNVSFDVVWANLRAERDRLKAGTP